MTTEAINTYSLVKLLGLGEFIQKVIRHYLVEEKDCEGIWSTSGED